MGIDSFPLTPTTFYRQDTAPPDAVDGATWLTNSDGSENDTTSRYQYNADADQWELNSAVGPSEPDRGTPVPGATWRDTANGNAKQYDGSEFVNLGVTDYNNLDNIPSFESESGSFIKALSGQGNQSVSFENTYKDAGVSASNAEQSGFGGDYAGAGFSSFITDANGDITGANISWEGRGNAGETATFRWIVYGEIA